MAMDFLGKLILISLPVLAVIITVSLLFCLCIWPIVKKIINRWRIEKIQKYVLILNSEENKERVIKKIRSLSNKCNFIIPTDDCYYVNPAIFRKGMYEKNRM